MAQSAKKLEALAELSADALTLIEHIAQILAEEYITLLKEEHDDENSDLRAVLKREPERAKH